MKISFITIIVFALNIQLSANNIIFVKEGATGNGKSWENAIGDLQAALQQATKGTQIWVAKGTYYPAECDHCNDRARGIVFNVKNGVELYGGFIGIEIKLNQRKWKQNPTILSGNIGRADMMDNSFSVVYTRNVGEETVVDGFIISDGNADGMAVERDLVRAGAGWYNDAENGESNPTIRNCVFMYNQASEGAAIFNNAFAGKANPILKNCTFVSNTATISGGAIFNYAIKGQSVGHFTNCKFVGNEAKIGGGVFAMGEAYLIERQLDFCIFINNKAEEGKSWHIESGLKVSEKMKNVLSASTGTNL